MANAIDKAVRAQGGGVVKPHQVKAMADFYSLNRRSDGYPSSQDSPLPEPSKVTNTLN